MEALVSAVAFLALFGLLLAASVTDIRERIVPNRLVLAIVAAWVAWRCALVALDVEGALLGAVEGLVGAFAFGGGLLAFTLLAEHVRGKHMFGGGDVKLLAAVSLFLGIEGALAALVAACVVSLAYALARSPRGIPFAPCILCGTLLAMLV